MTRHVCQGTLNIDPVSLHTCVAIAGSIPDRLMSQLPASFCFLAKDSGRGSGTGVDICSRVLIPREHERQHSFACCLLVGSRGRFTKGHELVMKGLQMISSLVKAVEKPVGSEQGPVEVENLLQLVATL